jgi:iron-sulfur cluster assembly accessory protein
MRYLLVASVMCIGLSASHSADSAEAPVAETKPAQAVITLTPAAATKIREILKETKAEDSTYLRVSVTAGGCSGFIYGLNLDSSPPTDADLRLKSEGVAVVVDRKCSLFLQGTKIDYYSGIKVAGFTFDNPNTVKEPCAAKETAAKQTDADKAPAARN